MPMRIFNDHFFQKFLLEGLIGHFAPLFKNPECAPGPLAAPVYLYLSYKKGKQELKSREFIESFLHFEIAL